MFKNLFSHHPEKNDGLTQPQREAIVDLLHFAMFADNFIALSETEFIEKEIESLNWDPKIDIDYYLGKSIGATRAAIASPEARKRFLASIRGRLATPKNAKVAFDLCEILFLSDGSKPDSEFASQGEIRQALGL